MIAIFVMIVICVIIVLTVIVATVVIQAIGRRSRGAEAMWKGCFFPALPCEPESNIFKGEMGHYFGFRV